MVIKYLFLECQLQVLDIGGRTYNIGISSTKLIVSQGIGSVAATGLVTFFNVQGKLPSPNDKLQ